MSELAAISVSCIFVYIWHLYKECENTKLLEKIRFVDPYDISQNPKVDAAEKAASILGSRICDTLPNQFVLVPCNVGAIKMFNTNKGKKGRQSQVWEVIKCQKQPDGSQCGFYVMRYMKDIIENIVSEGYYSKEEIDEVQRE